MSCTESYEIGCLKKELQERISELQREIAELRRELDWEHGVNADTQSRSAPGPGMSETLTPSCSGSSSLGSLPTNLSVWRELRLLAADK
jgi:hypothetical protein